MNSRHFFLLLLCLLTPISLIAKPDGKVSSKAQTYVLGDLSSGVIISEKNASLTIDPGPLTKLMALYVIFSALEAGDIRLKDKIRISETAAKAPAPHMLLAKGDRVKVEDLIKAIIIFGANDATSAVIEEIVWRTKSDFLATMNKKARSIGLATSNFEDPLGQKSNERGTTTLDLYLLSTAIIKDFPQYYPYFKLQQYEWQKRIQYSPNSLLGRDQHNDGLIMGRTPTVGFLGSISSNRNGRRILVVMGGTKSERTFGTEAQKLINHAFEAYETIHLFKSNTPIAQSLIAQGTDKVVDIGSFKDISVTIPRGKKENLKVHIESLEPLIAPIEYGTVVATLIIRLEDRTILTSDLIALKEARQTGILIRGWKELKSRVLQLIGS